MAYNGGGSDKFLEFIKTEVITAVDNTYRTSDFRILSGHSSAAFFALDTLLYGADLFHSYIAMTPWFYEDGKDQQLINN